MLHTDPHATATLLAITVIPREEVSRYLGHSSTDVTRRYARQTPDVLGRRAADALERSGLVRVTGDRPSEGLRRERKTQHGSSAASRSAGSRRRPSVAHPVRELEWHVRALENGARILTRVSLRPAAYDLDGIIVWVAVERREQRWQ